VTSRVCRWPGRWRAEALGAHGWRFEPDPPSGLEVLALDVREHTQVPVRADDASLRLEWTGGGVEILRQGDSDAERFHAAQAVVHEPMPRLYESLPLERLDRRARRFWARVFWLVRMPGGRRVLRWLARRR
jgi:hypothetical protein